MTPRRFNYILAAIFCAILLAGGGAYYLASQNLSEGTKKLSQRLADEQLADQKITALTDLQQQYNRLKPLIPVINNALPTEKNQSRIAIELRNIASQSGMNLDSLTFPSSAAPGPLSQTVKVGDVLAVPVSFQLLGTYEQLQHFLTRQENLDRYTSMTSLGITAQSGSGGRLNFDVTLNVYMKP